MEGHVGVNLEWMSVASDKGAFQLTLLPTSKKGDQQLTDSQRVCLVPVGVAQAQWLGIQPLRKHDSRPLLSWIFPEAACPKRGSDTVRGEAREVKQLSKKIQGCWREGGYVLNRAGPSKSGDKGKVKQSCRGVGHAMQKDRRRL